MRGRMPERISRADRADALIKASLRIAGQQLPVTVIDMSDRGCKIRCEEILPVGEVVELVLPAFQPSEASIRWSLAGMAGLRFI